MSQKAQRRASKPLVGAFYYPWYVKNFHGGDYLRGRNLDPPQLPTLGEYKSTDPEVIAQHIRWSEQANIRVWMCSWWGPDSGSDKVLRSSVMPSPEVAKADLQIALTYQPYKRLGRDCDDISNIASDIEYMNKHYFSNPSYLRIDGRPVFMIYVSRAIAKKGDLRKVVHTMREAADNIGIELYIIGDHIFGDVPLEGCAKLNRKANEVSLFDAITNYDVYAQTKAADSLYTSQENVDKYHARQSDWKELAKKVSTAFVPTVSPGFNDRGVRLEEDHDALARNLDGAPEGSLFRSLLKGSVPQVDKGADNLLLVTSFNEWHEDTQIEPVDECPPTKSDEKYTQGVGYRGYGTLYLDILKEETTRKRPECCTML